MGEESDDVDIERKELAHGESLCHVQVYFVLRQREVIEGIKGRPRMLKILIWNQ